MKRTATTLALLAGFGGGLSTAWAADPAGYATFGSGSQVKPAGMLTGSSGGECKDCAKPASHSHSHGSGAIYNTGPVNPPGILPVPGMGPAGAVAAVGAINPTMLQAPSNQRSSIKFVGPAGMKISWQLPTGGFGDEANALTAPASYNFLQGHVYRLKLGSILPNYPGKVFYPTLEVVNCNPKTVKFLAHSSVPVGFTNEDFDQAIAGNMVVKVIYLPDREFADFATIAGAEEIVSTRLDPGADPIAEAQKRGSILAILTLGNIDLENRFSPAMTQPSPYAGAMPMMPTTTTVSVGPPIPMPTQGMPMTPGMAMTPGTAMTPGMPMPMTSTPQPPLAGQAPSLMPKALPSSLKKDEGADRPTTLPTFVK